MGSRATVPDQLRPRLLLHRLSLYVVIGIVISCGPRSPVDSGSRVSFTDEGATLQSGYEGSSPTVEMKKTGDRWLVTVFQGRHNSGGYSIRIERLTTHGTALFIQARIEEPPTAPSATGGPSSPAHTVGIPFAPDKILMFDQSNHQLADIRLPSAP